MLLRQVVEAQWIATLFHEREVEGSVLVRGGIFAFQLIGSDLKGYDVYTITGGFSAYFSSCIP